MRSHRVLGLIGMLAALSAPTSGAASVPLQVCVDFGCQTLQTVGLADADWTQLRALLAASDSAAAERVAISNAIALLEDRVGRITGTWQDRAENWRRAGEPGELDCIAESRNTSHYLRAMEENGLLRWHRTRARAQRGFFVTVHWTAVIEQLNDNSLWAVDSWFRDNGQPAIVLPLQQWYQRKEPRT